MNKIKTILTIISISLTLSSCQVLKMGGDAKKNPPDPKLRVKNNLEQGKGFRLNDLVTGNKGGGTFEFASSNELWRASLDIIDFIPLASVNYSGGIIITDWYSGDNSEKLIKISIRFLTNEVRSDSLDIKIFTKKCNLQNKCKISEESDNLVTELKREILKKATIYKKENPDNKIKPYVLSTPGKD